MTDVFCIFTFFNTQILGYLFELSIVPIYAKNLPLWAGFDREADPIESVSEYRSGRNTK